MPENRANLRTTSWLAYRVLSKGAPVRCHVSSIMKAPLDGGSPIALASGQSSVWAAALDATSVWTTRTCTSRRPISAARNPPQSCCSECRSAEERRRPWRPGSRCRVQWCSRAPASSGRTCAYCQASLGFGACDFVGNLVSVPIGGGEPATIATDVFCGQMALDSASLYDGQSVERAPLAGGSGKARTSVETTVSGRRAHPAGPGILGATLAECRAPRPVRRAPRANRWTCCRRKRALRS